MTRPRPEGLPDAGPVPHWFTAWIERCIPGSFGEALVGDLLEEQAQRATRRPTWARLRFVLDAVGLAARWLMLRVARRIVSWVTPSSPDVLLPPPNRSTRGDSAVSTLLKDLRFAARSLRRQPGFTAIIVLTIAVGIAGNATVFSVTDALVLRPFPIPNLDQIVSVHGNVDPRTGNRDGVPGGDYLDFKASTPALSELYAERWWQPNLTATERPEKLTGRQVTPGYLELLGVRPVLGRTLAADRGTEQRATVVLSHALWQEKFGGDPSVLGRTLVLDGTSHEVVGVAPRGFDYPMGAQIWAVLDETEEGFDQRTFTSLNLIGRLAPGATLRAAESQLATTALRLERQFPETNKDRRAGAMPLSEAVVDLGVPRFLTAWQIATLFVLLIACVNVANLLIARSAERQREITLRAALGAGRPRILRMLFTESLVLALTGAALSLPLAWAGTQLIRASLPYRISRYVQGWTDIDLDTRVLLFATLVSVLAAVVFGLAPALYSSRVNLAAALHSGTRATSGTQRGRSVLVAAELALALVLLVSSTLMIRGTVRIMYGDQGYNPDQLLTAAFDLPKAGFDDDTARRNAMRDLLAEAREIPGVLSAESTNQLPSLGGRANRSLQVEGTPPAEGDDRPQAGLRVVSDGFLQQMEIPLLEGRPFTAADREDSSPVVIVSERTAKNLWPGRSPLGERIRLLEDDDGPWLTVVGVSGDVVQDWFMGGVFPVVYQPLSQRTRQGAYLTLRVEGDPDALSDELRAAAARVLPDVPLYEVAPMRRHMADRTAGLRFMSGLMVVFGAIALGLAALGVYGLMAQGVARRRHEFGIRMALGAQKQDVLLSTIGRSGLALGLGVIVGIAMAYGAAKVMAGALFGVVQLDWASFVQSPVALLVAATIATWIPAWRAARLDPAKTLRSE